MLVKVTEEKRLSKVATNESIFKYMEFRSVDDVVGCTTSNVYEDYLEFCKDNKIDDTFTSGQFKKRITLLFELTTKVYRIGGKNARVLLKKIGY